MKFKIGIMMFLLVKLIAFSEWKVVEQLDQFKESTGNYAMENRSFVSRIIRLSYIKSKKIFLMEIEFTGDVNEGFQNVLLKVDNEEPLTFKGKIISMDEGGYRLEIPETHGYFDISKNKKNFRELLREMRDGKILKIRISDKNDDAIIERFDLDNFDEAYKELSDM